MLGDLDEAGGWTGANESRIECDLIAVSGGTMPATSLLLQAGAKARWDEARGAYLPEGAPPGIHTAGAVAGHSSNDQAETSGAVAGAEAALSLELGDDADHDRLRADREALSVAEAPAELVPKAASGAAGGHGKCFACLCEDVTTDDLDYAIDEGFDSLELAKRYTTVTMGPCQGRMCQLASIRQVSERTATPVADVGLTTARPPWSTVPMGALAGRPFEPAKRSAVHGRHRELGGNVLWAGDWRRPYDYGDAQRRDHGRARERRPDRRLDPGQADRARPRRGRLPQPALPEPLRQPEAGPDSLRRPRRRRRPDHRRRHHLPARRSVVLRDHDLERRRRGRELVRLVAGGMGPRGPPHRRQPGALGLQPGRTATRARSSPGSRSSTARTTRSPTSTASAR